MKADIINLLGCIFIFFLINVIFGLIEYVTCNDIIEWIDGVQYCGGLP